MVSMASKVLWGNLEAVFAMTRRFLLLEVPWETWFGNVGIFGPIYILYLRYLIVS